jgi:cystathionine beta-synthase
MARRVIRQEGLLVGGSSGAAVWAMLQVARSAGPGKRIATILPDSVRNYMTKFVDDRWMRENGFTDTAWETGTLGDLLRSMPRRTLLTVRSADSVGESVRIMKEKGISQLPVVDDGAVVGIVTESDLLGKLVEHRATLASSVAEVMFRNVSTVHVHDDAGRLTSLFAEGLVGLVVDDADKLLGIVTKMDLVEHLSGNPPR